MKVSLVVASGVHQGKVVPVVGPQFLVGRDPECQLRPASQAVSKKHCAVIVRGEGVFLKDFGSTNGTVLNDGIVKDEERELRNNDRIQIGPLDFTLRLEASVARGDGTPLPGMDPAGSAALAAVRAAAAGSTVGPGKNPTPPPGAKPGSKEGPALTPASKAAPALKAPPAGSADETENDRLAAMLLGLDDAEVPGGSTVVDVPLVDLEAAAAAAGAAGAAAAAKPDDKKPMPTREGTSNAASEILRKYMKRPR